MQKRKTQTLEDFTSSVEGTKAAPLWHGMDPGAARYKAGNPEAKAVSLPMNQYEYLRLIEAAKKANRKPLDFIRNAVAVAVAKELD